MTHAHDRHPVVGVVVVAAGMGTRLGAGMPKALVPVAGEPLVVHALRQVYAVPGLAAVVVVVPAGHRAEFAALAMGLDTVAALPTRPSGEGPVAALPTRPPGEGPVAALPTRPPRTGGRVAEERSGGAYRDPIFVDGGAERTDSVAAGLAALPPECEFVLIHDAARAFAPAALFGSVVAALEAGADAVVPGLPVADTIKRVGDDGHVEATLPRDRLRAIQTPQGFRRTVLDSAHAAGLQATDDAALVEAAGGRVRVIDGSPEAFKVTTPQDLLRARRRHAQVTPMLVVLAGLPGVGKSTVARELAQRAGLVHLRVDTIEQAMRASGEMERPMVAGYVVAYAVASDQLDRGLSVVADTVNPIEATREAWRQVAVDSGVPMLQVELVCSDVREHERRAVTRSSDIAGLEPPSWSAIVEREYADFDPDLRIDTAQVSPGRAAELILEAMQHVG